jgi:antitoxin MazE
MKACVQKWGNSLALRIPMSFAEETGLEQDTPVEVSVVDGKLVIVPLVEPTVSLDELLAGVTPENLQGEVNMGPAVGKEVW